MSELQIDTAKLFDTAFLHWRTTAIGSCILILAVRDSVHFNAAGQFAMTQHDWFTLCMGVLAQVIAIMQKDAGKGVAIVPDKAEPQLVDTHGIPDDPANKLVK